MQSVHTDCGSKTEAEGGQVGSCGKQQWVQPLDIGYTSITI